MSVRTPYLCFFSTWPRVNTKVIWHTYTPIYIYKPNKHIPVVCGHNSVQ